MIEACVQRVWAEHPQTNDVIVAVHASNRASWRSLERADFHRIAEGPLKPDNPEDSNDHYVYHRSRASIGRRVRGARIRT